MTTGSPITNDHARTNKNAAVKKLTKSYSESTKDLTEDQAALATFEMFNGPKKIIGKKLGITSPIVGPKASEKAMVALDIVENINDLLHHPLILGSNSNDAISFQTILFQALVPPAPGDHENDSPSWKRHFKVLSEIATVLGIKPKSAAEKHLSTASIARRIINIETAAGKGVLFCLLHKRDYMKYWTDDKKEIVLDWILRHLVTQSSRQRDTILIKNPNDPLGDKIRVAKHYYEEGVRVLWNKLTDPTTGCPLCFNAETGIATISQSFLSSILPKYIQRRKKSQKETMGCTFCIDDKGMMMSYNGWQMARLKHHKDTLK